MPNARTICLLSFLCLTASPAAAQQAKFAQGKTRYGVPVDGRRYPQGEPRQAIRSVIKAVEAGDIAYLMAQLLDPSEVDDKLAGDAVAFDKLVSQATPQKSKKLVTALRRQLEEGTWTLKGDQARATLEGLPDLTLANIGGRWHMHNTPTQ